MITFEQHLNELNGIKIIFHNALSFRKYIGCVRNDKWFHGADIMIFAEARILPKDDLTIGGFDIIYRPDRNNVGKTFLRVLIVYKKHQRDITVVEKLTYES